MEEGKQGRIEEDDEKERCPVSRHSEWEMQWRSDSALVRPSSSKLYLVGGPCCVLRGCVASELG